MPAPTPASPLLSPTPTLARAAVMAQAVPPATLSTSPTAPASTDAATPAARARSGGPTFFGTAFVLGALVMVGGLAFAAGRFSADGSDSSSGLAGGQAAAVAAEAGGTGNGDFPDGFSGRGTFGTQPAADGFAEQAATIGTDERAQAEDPGGAPPTGQGFPGFDGQGPAGGFAVGGIEGRVTGIGDMGITLESTGGETLQFIVEASTRFATQRPSDPSAIETGDVVRVAFPLTQFEDGQAFEPPDAASVASTVTVLPPGTELAEGPFGPGGAAGPPPGEGFGGGAGGAGAGGRPGFGGLGTEGTVAAISDGELTLTLADGSTRSVPIDASTTFVSEELADESRLAVGSEVRVRVAQGGFGQGGAQEPGQPRQSAQITILDVPSP